MYAVPLFVPPCYQRHTSLPPPLCSICRVDSDLESYPPDIIQRLLAADKQIIVPNCVMTPGGRSYDLNSWRSEHTERSYGNNASVALIQKMHDAIHAKLVAAGTPNLLQMEGYSSTGHRCVTVREAERQSVSECE